MIVDAVIDDALSPDFPLGDAVETFVRREDAERFVEEVGGDDREAAARLSRWGAELRGLLNQRQSKPRTEARGAQVEHLIRD